MQERASHGPSRRRVLRRIGAGTAIGAGALAGCLGDLEDYEEGDIETIGSVEQVAVLEREPEVEVTLVENGDEVAVGETDGEGTYLFTEVPPGEYRIRDEDEREESAVVTVMAPGDHPEQDHYDDQTLEEGYGYIETRDGTTLGCQVVLPEGESEPYPTVIDYSGYQPSKQFYDSLDDRFTDLGYAVVGVNMRGTGCSGGAFDYFERLQALDGYDIVETVAAQGWADGVGLVGKSYPGISQLFVAAEQPPSLDAIVPGHVVGDFYRGVVYPGGIRNDGFAVDWAILQERRIDNTAHLWVSERAEDDEECADNQRIRGQSPDLRGRIEDHETDDELWNERRPWDLVGDIEAPTLLVNSWQDEQTAGRPANLLEQFDDDTVVRFLGCNGDHGEYFGPTVFADIQRFLAYYLEGTIPEEDADEYEDFEAALAAYEDEDPFRVYWELGAGGDGDRDPTGHVDFAEWPPEMADIEEFYLHPEGRLGSTEPPDDGGATAFDFEPGDRLGEGNIDDWAPPPAGTAAAFVSDPLEEDTPVLGPISVTLWLEADADDVDVCVMLTEVREDGQEVYVQPAWQRASHRAEDEERSTALRPWHEHTESAIESMDGRERVRVEVFPAGHVFRSGSRIGLWVEAPGGNRERWAFDVIEDVTEVTVAHDAEHPSVCSLPVLSNVDVPAEQPPCDSLHHQPCREYRGP